MEFNHKSVLLDEVIKYLDIKPGGIYVDGTLGGAGHGSVVCSKLGEGGRFVGMDQDGDAIAASRKKLEPYKDRVNIVRSNYSDMTDVLHDLGIEKVDGITLDLGVSSFQLDTIQRGFSYRWDAPLDMRMDDRQELTAEKIVNEYSEREQVCKEYCKKYCPGETGENDKNDGRAGGYHQLFHSDENKKAGGTSCETNLSGNSD